MAVFESTVVEHIEGNSFRVKLNLTMHGKKRPVTFEADFDGIVADQFGGQHLGASGTLTIDRTHWDMVFNQPIASGVMVGDKVKVDLVLSALDQATAEKMGLAKRSAA
jgi:polyisoprenoid-binding protein YceI